MMSKKELTKFRKDFESIEQVIGCKWSVSVLMAVKNGIDRPGRLERSIEGISTKVLSERLRKLTAFGLMNKKQFHEFPLRTEYSLTHKGKKVADIISQLYELDND